MKPSTILTKARDILIDTGWCQKALFVGESKKEMSVCAVGSVYAVTRKLTVEDGVIYEGEVKKKVGVYNENDATKFLDDASPHLDVINFNDAAGRKKSEVVRVFDAAIAAAKEAGR